MCMYAEVAEKRVVFSRCRYQCQDSSPQTIAALKSAALHRPMLTVMVAASAAAAKGRGHKQLTPGPECCRVQSQNVAFSGCRGQRKVRRTSDAPGNNHLCSAFRQRILVQAASDFGRGLCQCYVGKEDPGQRVTPELSDLDL